MKPLCNKCKNYLIDGNDTFCKYDEWPCIAVTKSKIYNPYMFECINYSRTVKRYLYCPPEL